MNGIAASQMRFLCIGKKLSAPIIQMRRKRVRKRERESKAGNYQKHDTQSYIEQLFKTEILEWIGGNAFVFKCIAFDLFKVLPGYPQPVTNRNNVSVKTGFLLFSGINPFFFAILRMNRIFASHRIAFGIVVADIGIK